MIYKNTTKGNTAGEYRIGLAPMAGTTDVTFRRICKGFGSEFGCTELVSARGIAYRKSVESSFRYLMIDPEGEGPCAIQLFGHEPKDFAEAIPIVLSHPVLSHASHIDLNMGCPVSKVVKTGAGAALMLDLPRAFKIIEASVRASETFGLKVTVKFRKGWDEKHINAVEFARMCADAGASSITIHARTRDQMYGGAADWTIIAEAVECLRKTGVLVIGNGDVCDGASAERMRIETGADGVAIGRAALGNPWIFKEIRSHLGKDACFREPTALERSEVMLLHLEGLTERLGEERGIKEMRTQLAHYLKGRQNAAEYRSVAVRARTKSEVRDIIHRWTESADTV